jgi:hypothetical protein
VLLLTLYVLPMTSRCTVSSSGIGTVQFVMSHYGNFTKEIDPPGQLFSIPDV